MSSTLLALLAFVAWTVLLLLAIGAARVGKVLAGQAQPNQFPGGVQHGSDAYWRLNRAHLNCVEFLPLYGAVVLAAAVVGAESETLTRLAWVVPVARVGQSLAHLSSGGNLAVNVRFGFFAIQMICVVAMGIVVATHL